MQEVDDIPLSNFEIGDNIIEQVSDIDIDPQFTSREDELLIQASQKHKAQFRKNNMDLLSSSDDELLLQISQKHQEDLVSQLNTRVYKFKRPSTCGFKTGLQAGSIPGVASISNSGSNHINNIGFKFMINTG